MRFIHVKDPDRDRGDNPEEIIAKAYIEVISATKVNDTDTIYVCRLTDINLDDPVVFSFTLNSNELRVTSVESVEIPSISNPPEQISVAVDEVLGNNLSGELCYGVVFQNEKLPKPVEWDLFIDKSGNLSYDHTDYADPSDWIIQE